MSMESWLQKQEREEQIKRKEQAKRAVMDHWWEFNNFQQKANHDQPEPIKNENPAIWHVVIMDMLNRDHVGRGRYKTPLQPHNGRDALSDAYQEALDLAVYLRQAIYERDGK